MKKLILFVAMIASLSLIGCSATPAPTVTVTVTAPAPESSSPSSTPTSTTKALTDAEIEANMVDKFWYLQSSERLEQFKISGYNFAKVRLAKDIMKGKFGKATTERFGSKKEPMLSVSVGEDSTSKIYAWYYVNLNKAGKPDYDTVWNLAIQLPGHDYVEITDTIHDWESEIAGRSVRLRYTVRYGSNRLTTDMETCNWPSVEIERKVCYSDNYTETVDDIADSDYAALGVMAESMSVLYGTNWYRKG